MIADRKPLTGDHRHDTEFYEFHEKHPEVFVLYRKFALQLLRYRERGSSEQVIQRVRWETDVNPNKHGGYKVRNAFRRRYAVLLTLLDSRFVGFFTFYKDARVPRKR